MKTVALVPVKMLTAAKSRMHPCLTRAERIHLARTLLRGTLHVLQSSGVVTMVGIISPDTQVLAYAKRVGATPLRQGTFQPALLSSLGGLNIALEYGRTWALAQGTEALLVVLPDLPLLGVADIRSILQHGAREASLEKVVLAPDRRRQGTNLMLLRPAHLLPFAFGLHSYHKHMEMARARGVEPLIFSTPGTELDLDTPDDLDALASLAASGRDFSLTALLHRSGGSPNDPESLNCWPSISVC